MSCEQYAFMQKGRLPNRAAIQSALDAAGIELQVDPELNLATDTGFMPCTLLGLDSGVEIYCEDSPDALLEFGDLAMGKNCCVSFRWGGSMAECACAMAMSFALAQLADAVVSYEGEEPYDGPAPLLADTRACINDALKEIEREKRRREKS